jgi:hypothetical protein
VADSGLWLVHWGVDGEMWSRSMVQCLMHCMWDDWIIAHLWDSPQLSC